MNYLSQFSLFRACCEFRQQPYWRVRRFRWTSLNAGSRGPEKNSQTAFSHLGGAALQLSQDLALEDYLHPNCFLSCEKEASHHLYSRGCASRSPLGCSRALEPKDFQINRRIGSVSFKRLDWRLCSLLVDGVLKLIQKWGQQILSHIKLSLRLIGFLLVIPPSYRSVQFLTQAKLRLSNQYCSKLSDASHLLRSSTLADQRLDQSVPLAYPHDFNYRWELVTWLSLTPI